ncbi:MAG: GGDEF domain-containing protein [Deltaproteobacteria bacterium]|nr:GGDEF domain-containing protein [Deltaproteobacteria bacterium]
MTNLITQVPTVNFNIQEFFSLALETLIEEVEGQYAYWFNHAENSIFWKTSHLPAKDTFFFKKDSTYEFSKTETLNIKKIASSFSETAWVEKPQFEDNSKITLGSMLVIPVETQGERVATIVIMNVKRDFHVENFKKKLSLFLRQIKITLRSLHTQNLAFIDDMTGLYNSRAFKMFLDQTYSQARRSGDYFSVLLIDIDYLKKVNDTHGHLAGDALLKETGIVIRGSCRSKDKVFRYGGDEFAVILVHSNTQQAHIIAERIRKKIEETVFEVKTNANIKITVCIGIASFPEHSKTKEEILKLADDAMYCGKDSSRNRVSIA